MPDLPPPPNPNTNPPAGTNGPGSFPDTPTTNPDTPWPNVPPGVPAAGWGSTTDPDGGPKPSTGTRLRSLARFVVPAIVLGGMLLSYLGQADRDADGTIVAAGKVTASDLRVGDCFDDRADEAQSEATVEIADVAAVPCGDPHDNEVFHAFELAGTTLPSDEEVFTLVDERCVPAFDEYVGQSFLTSELDLFPIWPTAEAFAAGDRMVLCSVYPMDGSKLTGSVRGSGR
ncbi:septum formation family protein [Egicoccus sp. AB-alg2]|uniref:septum formation family protein n=1 Tax=Egicoccus sp. AB-alg2 TaxID=3242693 RepID=UPI00359F1336